VPARPVASTPGSAAPIAPWESTRENTPPLPLGYTPAYALGVPPPDAPRPPAPVELPRP
jgi:hypothetical protein